jgi:NAD(P)-dependent dehydrogenase (short-subunit alcohol dehydrogenase family)
MSDDGLRGKVFLATGSGRGLGAALARAAAAEGARVVVHGKKDEKAVDALAAELGRKGGEVLAVHGNVTDPDEARTLVGEVITRWGRIDVLVNTVGTFSWKSLVEVDPAEWRRILASNLDSVFHMCRLAVPHMRERHFGRIVNFASVGATTQCEPQLGAFSAAKAGVIALSRALALEEARFGITVNVVSPGLIREDGEPNGANGADTLLGQRVPVGHTGTAQDVVRAVLFFAAPAAEYVTGQVIEVAGGARI